MINNNTNRSQNFFRRDLLMKNFLFGDGIFVFPSRLILMSLETPVTITTDTPLGPENTEGSEEAARNLIIDLDNFQSETIDLDQISQEPDESSDSSLDNVLTSFREKSSEERYLESLLKVGLIQSRYLRPLIQALQVEIDPNNRHELKLPIGDFGLDASIIKNNGKIEIFLAPDVVWRFDNFAEFGKQLNSGKFLRDHSTKMFAEKKHYEENNALDLWNAIKKPVKCFLHGRAEITVEMADIGLNGEDSYTFDAYSFFDAVRKFERIKKFVDQKKSLSGLIRSDSQNSILSQRMANFNVRGNTDLSYSASAQINQTSENRDALNKLEAREKASREIDNLRSVLEPKTNKGAEPYIGKLERIVNLPNTEEHKYLSTLLEFSWLTRRDPGEGIIFYRNFSGAPYSFYTMKSRQLIYHGNDMNEALNKISEMLQETKKAKSSLEKHLRKNNYNLVNGVRISTRIGSKIILVNKDGFRAVCDLDSNDLTDLIEKGFILNKNVNIVDRNTVIERYGGFGNGLPIYPTVSEDSDYTRSKAQLVSVAVGTIDNEVVKNLMYYYLLESLPIVSSQDQSFNNSNYINTQIDFYLSQILSDELNLTRNNLSEILNREENINKIIQYFSDATKVPEVTNQDGDHVHIDSESTEAPSESPQSDLNSWNDTLIEYIREKPKLFAFLQIKMKRIGNMADLLAENFDKDEFIDSYRNELLRITKEVMKNINLTEEEAIVKIKTHVMRPDQYLIYSKAKKSESSSRELFSVPSYERSNDQSVETEYINDLQPLNGVQIRDYPQKIERFKEYRDDYKKLSDLIKDQETRLALLNDTDSDFRLLLESDLTRNHNKAERMLRTLEVREKEYFLAAMIYATMSRVPGQIEEVANYKLSGNTNEVRFELNRNEKKYLFAFTSSGEINIYKGISTNSQTFLSYSPSPSFIINYEVDFNKISTVGFQLIQRFEKEIRSEPEKTQEQLANEVIQERATSLRASVEIDAQENIQDSRVSNEGKTKTRRQDRSHNRHLRFNQRAINRNNRKGSHAREE